MKKVLIHSDGSALKNPFGGYFCGAGTVLVFGSKEKHISIPLPDATNNIAELTAAINGLKALKEPCIVDLYTDSQYTKNCITKWISSWKRRGWKTQEGHPVKNQALIIELDRLCRIHQVSWHWVKGHNGDHYNEMADSLARKASESLKEAAK